MVHTLPDYTTKYRLSTIFSQVDVAELAARLGSPNVWDRRGNIIWYDTINSTGNKWNKASNGTGGSCTVSNEYAMFGDYSMKLVGGSDGLKQASMYKKFQLITVGNLGLECAFSTDYNVDYFLLQFEYRDNNIVQDGRIKVDRTNALLRYMDQNQVYHTIASDLKFATDFTLFNTLKLVVDNKNAEYVRVIYCDKEYDISGIPVRTFASATMGYFSVFLQIFSNDGSNGTGYVDYFILTQNEP